MKLNDLHGQAFELRILGYQFPDNLEDKWDSNWLNIQITVDSKEGKWSKTDPSLMTDEVERLSEWFYMLSHSRQVDVLEFTEPNLKFKYVITNESCKIKIYFELEMRPDWNQKNWVGDDSFFIELSLSKKDFLKAAKELRDELKLFPYRHAMKPSEITKIIEMEINGNWSVANPHDIDIKKCLVNPPAFKTFEDNTQVENGEIGLWLVLEESPEDKAGYKIIFDEKTHMFGLATKGLKGGDGFIGFYGTFLNTLQAM